MLKVLRVYFPVGDCGGVVCRGRNKVIDLHSALSLGPNEHLGMLLGLHDVTASGKPVVLHRSARKIIIFRIAFIGCRLVNELHNTVRSGIGAGCQKTCLGGCRQFRRHSSEQIMERRTKTLDHAKIGCRRASPAGVLDLLHPDGNFGEIARQLSPSAPQINLKDERVELRAR